LGALVLPNHSLSRQQPEKSVVIPNLAVVKFKAGKKLKAEIEALNLKTLKK
jgi:hypothetical protein